MSPSRRLIENLLNNKNDQSIDSMSFCDASRSSALASIEVNSIGGQLSKIINLLAGPAFQVLSSEVEKRIAENPDEKLRANQIME